jgi:hypothetical protein
MGLTLSDRRVLTFRYHPLSTGPETTSMGIMTVNELVGELVANCVGILVDVR